jgi:hypothetical protein
LVNLKPFGDKIMKMKQLKTLRFYVNDDYTVDVDVSNLKDEDTNTNFYIVHKDYGTKLFFAGMKIEDELFKNREAYHMFCEMIIMNNIDVMIDSYEDMIDKMES